jgi:hypothetical protein
MDKKTLEQLLQTYFGCKKAFRTDGYSTTAGENAAHKLKSLLIDLGYLVGSRDRRDDMNKIVEDISKTMVYGGELPKDYQPEYKKTAGCLEEILQTYFGSKRPFKICGQFTESGGRAYTKLISLLYEFSEIYDINGKINDIVDTLDYIADEAPYVTP